MPHGQLTPLGKQLRSVLANIATTPKPKTIWSTRPKNTACRHRHSVRFLHHAPSTHAAARNGAVEHERERATTYTPVKFEPNSRFDGRPARIVRKGERIDHLTNALKVVGDPAVIPYQSSRKLDLSYIDPKRRPGHEEYNEYLERKERHTTLPASNRNVSLQQILAAYILRSGTSELLKAGWEPHSSKDSTSDLEADFLRSKGHDLADVAAWADIATEPATTVAAEKLLQRTRERGALSTPLFLYLNLLRRPHISAKALHLLLLCGHELFQQRAQMLTNPGIDDEPRLLVTIRLMRHARMVWHAALPSTMELALQHMQAKELTDGRIQLATYQLNLLLKLASLSPTEQPFKDTIYQERAIIPVLRFMAEHDPPLLINREGYRAVIRLQLAQSKTSLEMQWAELKSLSWPPWKADRTAMDAAIDIETHGTSRAARTLAAMRQAGYPPRQWEKTAQIYAGWDVDGTPTVQTLARLDTLSRQPTQHDHSIWAARIATTRTIQEAWACYLAWEDESLPHNSEVYLAIATKLREEHRRPHLESRRISPAWTEKGRSPVFAGDGRELSPLPPSTHLYTYTRTVPPSLDRFYADLRAKGAILGPDCLAFFIAHASTLETGLSCLRDHIAQYPGIRDILSLIASEDLSQIPLPVFTAAVTLFGRFSYISAAKVAHVQLTTDWRAPLLHKTTGLDPKIGIVRAIELLRLRPDPHPQLWNAVFSGLTRETHLSRLAGLLITRSDEGHDDEFGDMHTRELSEDLARSEGALNAYALMRSVVYIRYKNRIDWDLNSFYSFCVATENSVMGAWLVLEEIKARYASRIPEDVRSRGVMNRLICAVKSVFLSNHNHRPSTALRRDFDALVSSTKSPSTGPQSTLDSLPRLLAVPSPAALHVYIRALGWAADYEGLVNLVRWMRDYRAELAERRDLDRNGHDMMRKAIVALRVFLERSFLRADDNGDRFASPSSSGMHSYRPISDLETPVQEKKTTDGSMADGGEHEKYEQWRVKGLKLLEQFKTAATEEQIGTVREVVESVEEWGGWARDEQLERYVAHKRFDRVR